MALNLQYLMLKNRMIELNDQMNAVADMLFVPKPNPYARLALFQKDPPHSVEDAAGKLVGSMGYILAMEMCDKTGENADSLEEAEAWHMLGEFISEMYENELKKEGKIRLSTSYATDLAAGPEDSTEDSIEEAKGIQESFSLNITLNEKQKMAEEFAFNGKSFCLIGPAGSGKTTTQRAVSKALWNSGKLLTSNFKPAGAGSDVSAPSIAFCAFTRRAAGNLRKAIHKDAELAEIFKHNIMTVHALLEYAPEFYTDANGEQKFRFAPRRNARNPLNITHLVIEEASQIGAYDLWQKLYEALPPNVQIIFIGDINQLPPAFGPSILNYALIQLPIVELTETYRNQGIVLENAHHILKGEALEENNDFRIIRGNKPIQLGQQQMSSVCNKLLKAMMDSIGDDGLPEYDPDHDMVLSSFNVQPMGTDNMNAWIAQTLGEKRGAVVHEVIAGFKKHYLAVGDKVMVNKRDGVIKDIYRNPDYFGKEPQLAGKDLSRFGERIVGAASGISLDDIENSGIDYSAFSLEKLEEEKMERKQQASHCLVVDYGDGYEEEISAVGDLSDAAFSLGYCLTVYKAQGSEWRKVIILMHKDHTVQLFRESFYTAVTRARTKVDIVAKDYLITSTIARQRIKGNTLKDKLAFFNSGINNTVDVQILKKEN